MIQERTKFDVLQERINQAIAARSPHASQSIHQLISRGGLQRDTVLPMKELVFEAEEHVGDRMRLGYRHAERNELDRTSGYLHLNAIEQVSTKLNVPTAYAKRLAQGPEWQVRLLADTFNEMLQNGSANDNMLTRNVGNEMRGFLSDRYRRMNMTPIFTEFAKRTAEMGAVVYNGHCGDLKSSLEVLMPGIRQITTPKNGTIYTAFGLHISSSDFGKGALSVKSFRLEAWCTNGAIGQNHLKQIHLGRRLEEGDFSFSDRTFELDTMAMTSAVRDIVGQSLSDTAIDREIARIMHLSNIEIDVEKKMKELPKMGLSKEEAQAVEEIFGRSNPEDGVTGQATMYKLQSSITAYARVAGPDRERELQEIAGNL